MSIIINKLNEKYSFKTILLCIQKYNDNTILLTFENNIPIETDYNSCMALKKNWKQCNNEIRINKYCKTCFTQTMRNIDTTGYCIPDYGRIDIPRTKFNYKNGRKRNVPNWTGNAQKDINLKYNKILSELDDECISPKLNNIINEEIINEEIINEEIICDIQSLTFIKDYNTKVTEYKDENIDKETTEIVNLDDLYSIKKIIYQGVLYYLHNNKDIYNKINMKCIGNINDNNIYFSDKYEKYHESQIINEEQQNIIYINI